MKKMLISNRCISGLMSNLIKKSWTVSMLQATADRKIHLIKLDISNWTIPKNQVQIDRGFGFLSWLSRQEPKDRSRNRQEIL